MAFNKDIDSIFNRYVKNILEAVKPTEDSNYTQMPSAETIKATQERLKAEGAKKVVDAANTLKQETGQTSGTVYSKPGGGFTTKGPVTNQGTQLATQTQNSTIQPQANPSDEEEVNQFLGQTTTTTTVPTYDDGSDVSQEDINNSQNIKYETIPASDSELSNKSSELQALQDELNQLLQRK